MTSKKIHKGDFSDTETYSALCDQAGGTFLYGVDYAWKIVKQWGRVTCKRCLRARL